MSTMKIHTIEPVQGSKKDKKRLGRGIGSGLGKTGGKGHKGQNARSGGGVRIGFEGGQMPLTRRLPKRGFTSNFRKVYSVINICDLEVFSDGDEVTIAALLERGIVRKAEPYGLKVLGNGELTKKLTVKAAKFSQSAKELIEKLGGTAEVV